MASGQQGAVWRNHSSQWQKVGAPLRPTAQDGALMLAAARPALEAADNAEAQVAILGVTPELVQLGWPGHIRLSAFDHSAEMIASVWRPHPHNPATVHLAAWQQLPLPDAAVHLAIGDGSFNVLPDLAAYAEVLAELRRVLRPDALLCIRAFIRPDRIETLEEVAGDAEAGRIAGFYAFKWRVAMTLSTAPDFSVRVGDIHAAFEARFEDRDRLARQTGWPREIIDTIDAYRGLDTRYSFPTLDALVVACMPFATLVATAYGTYELADRCPTLSFCFP